MVDIPTIHILEVPCIRILHCLLVSDGHIMVGIVGHVVSVLLHVLTAHTEGTDLTIVMCIGEGHNLACFIIGITMVVSEFRNHITRLCNNLVVLVWQNLFSLNGITSFAIS